MVQSAGVAQSVIHCINPDCAQPYPQTGGNRFCQSCGSHLLLHDRYLPLKRLGSGGFAVTYTAYDLQSQTEKVLKVLVDQVPKARELFQQEAQVLASLEHPGIPRVEPGSYFEVQVGNPPQRSLPCLVMEKINGQTLDELLENYPQGCPEAWVVDWFHQSVEILKVLHQRQIIHRDLKPANLMLRQGTGQLVMIDFGGAKQMQLVTAYPQASSTRLVSPGYSPPEQASGGKIQPATDFYALGRTLIHVLTGLYPADLEDPNTGELKWRERVQVNPELANLLDDLTQADVQQRPATAEDIQVRLCRIAPPSPARTQKAIGGLSALQQRLLQAVRHGVVRLKQGVIHLSKAVFHLLVWAVKATVDTLWSMVLAAVGGAIGAIFGFAIAYTSSFGIDLSDWLSYRLTQLTPGLTLTVTPDFLMFGLAGLGTALGLTLAGGFGQQRRVFLASFMGIVSYLSGWLGLQIAAPDGILIGLAVFTAIAPALLTLGLGLSSHHLLYSVITATGVTPLIASLFALDANFAEILSQLLISGNLAPQVDGNSLVACLVFFSLVGSILGCCLGITRYLFIPVLRWLDGQQS